MGWNQVINRWDVVDVVVVRVFVFVVVVVVVVVVVIVDFVVVVPLKFGHKCVTNSWIIADIEFMWVVSGGGGGFCAKVIFMSSPNLS